MENQIIVEIENITSDSLVALNILMSSNADQPVTPESNTQYQEIRALRALQSLNKKVRRNMLSVEQKANNREKDAARKRDIRCKLSEEKKQKNREKDASKKQDIRNILSEEQKENNREKDAANKQDIRKSMPLEKK